MNSSTHVFIARNMKFSEASDYEQHVIPRLGQEYVARPVYRLPKGSYVAGESVIGWELHCVGDRRE